jgi:hypothetical protein
MSGIRAIIRDSPAGQIGRLYLGLKIAPYADELEGFDFSTERIAEEERRESDASHDPEKDDASRDGTSDEQISDRDVELHAADEASRAQPKSDRTAVEFTGPNDLDNPQNWSTAKKTFVFVQICLLTFASQCGSSVSRCKSLHEHR